ncbi:hypothetical protein C7974DRAFT_405758 [Boeremia exigua]|uniref:uncharacterized protein n=1 Tax=Boeremia exigua TaxID=749465 RepID=UPI001E8D2440|nr:uncharacterized protein C7974DRAFT_405758 [Boeremia exigua]KAH6612527.1 hypothetical protein C7974DRAFT_405758 [Boeremia exigua]
MTYKSLQMPDHLRSEVLFQEQEITLVGQHSTRATNIVNERQQPCHFLHLPVPRRTVGQSRLARLSCLSSARCSTLTQLYSQRSLRIRSLACAVIADQVAVYGAAHVVADMTVTTHVLSVTSMATTINWPLCLVYVTGSLSAAAVVLL